MPTITTCAFNERKTTEVTCGYESERKTRTNDTVTQMCYTLVTNLSEFYLREQTNEMSSCAKHKRANHLRITCDNT